MSNQGKIVQIIGAVVDVEFPRESVPRVYDALKVQNTAITLEVQQQLGDGVVRTIALGSTDGLKRNLVAENTGKAVSVPVGTGTLGRIMNVLGEPIDEAGPVEATEHVHDPAQRALADRHRDAAAGVGGHEVALQAVGGTEGDRAHDAVAQLLLHFKRDLCAVHLQRVVHVRHAVARELDVDDGADDLDDLALVAHVWNSADSV